MGSNGVWEITTSALDDGVHTIGVEIEDLAGNINSALTNTLDVTVDTTLPQRPTLDLLAADDSGMSDLDNVTNRADAVPFTITSEAGATVVLKDGNTVQTLVSPAGTSFTSSGTDVVTLNLTPGTHLLSVEVTDDAGNVSQQSEELVVVIDRLAPDLSLIHI